jgi:predicted dithiol-disulfide oxidoreductase (DUF899 family)
MTSHKVGTREEWLQARLELLEAEKEHTRRSDELARRRQELPWVPIEKDYRFETEDGPASLGDLFRGRSQLLMQHFMFPGCPSCSSMADGYEGIAIHLFNHDVAMVKVSRYPIEELTAYNKRMGWSVPYVSSMGSDFNYDFGVAFTEDDPRARFLRGEDVESENIRFDMNLKWDHSDTPEESYPAYAGIPDPNEPPKDGQGMSAFTMDDGVVYHTYSAYARGVDVLWNMFQWLDRAPLGRNESGRWYKLHDEYQDQPSASTPSS